MATYTIKKGRHYSTNWLGLFFRFLFGWHFGSEQRVVVRFSKSCLHGNDDPLDAKDELKDRHKVFGLSSSFFSHHESSARFAWVEHNGYIRLYTYVYSGGRKLKDKGIMTIPVERDYVLVLQRATHVWWFTLETIEGTIIASKSVLVKGKTGPHIYRKLYPYYGGDHPAKVDTKITLEWI